MRRYLAFGALALLVALFWLRQSGRAPAPLSAPLPEAIPTAHPALEPHAADEPPLRNPFEYADEAASLRPALEPPAVPSPDAAVPVSSDAAADAGLSGVRLVGLVRQDGTLKAALFLGDELVVLAPGQAWDGYHVVDVDQDRGVRLRGSEGEITLRLPE